MKYLFSELLIDIPIRGSGFEGIPEKYFYSFAKLKLRELGLKSEGEIH